MSNKNIVFLLPDIKGGGAEKSVINLCLSIQEHSNYTCHLLVLGNVAEYDINDINVHFLDIKNKIKKSGIHRFTYRDKAAKYIDGFIIDNFGKETKVFSNMILCDKIMSKSRLNVHHIIRNSYGSSLLKGKSWFKKKMEVSNISKTYSNHPLIFVSQGAMDSFCTHFHSNVPKQVIYNAIDADRIKLFASDYTPDESNYILHIGRFNHQKRHDNLIKIYAKSAIDNPLLIMGKGELRDNIENKIISHGIDDKVKLIDFKSNPYPYIKHSQLVLLTSDFEGLPRVMMEAVALEKPVIAFDSVGGIREVITNPNSLVPMEDFDGFVTKMHDAINHPQRYISSPRKEFMPKFICEQFIKLI
ncbi:glycosyltransferase [Vibrio sp. MA40-2]|uniref:glycosyltransferase n=1 Tax=Vibrio sp. MA40-2 TaxID=3391828 RepID=UPI0039A662C4